MSFNRDESAAPELCFLLLQYQDNVLSHVLRTDVIQPKLDDAWQFRLSLEKQFGEIEVMRENHSFIFNRPARDVRIRCVRRAKLTPVPGGVSVLPKISHPGLRQTIVNHDGHAG